MNRADNNPPLLRQAEESLVLSQQSIRPVVDGPLTALTRARYTTAGFYVRRALHILAEMNTETSRDPETDALHEGEIRHQLELIRGEIKRATGKDCMTEDKWIHETIWEESEAA